MKKQTAQDNGMEMKAGGRKLRLETAKTRTSAVIKILNLIKSEVRTIMGEAFMRTHQRGTKFARTVFPAVLAVSAALWLMVSGSAIADTAGPSNPSSASNNSSIGTQSWSNTSNIFSSDNSDARASSLGQNEISNYLVATDFNFSIPSGATIQGIKVDIERAEGNTSSSAYIRDSSIRIVKGGAITGTNHASTGANWPTSDQTASYGSTTDLWGQTWTSSDINAGNFGVALSVVGYGSSSNSENALVDNIKITVYYTSAGSCTANAPTVTITPAAQIIATDGGSAVYQATITNNDSGAGCSSVTYALSATDSNTTNFNASTLGASSVSVAPGSTSAGITLTVSGAGGQTSGTNTTTVTAAATGHATGSSSVNTTLSVSPSCTAAAPTLQIAPASQSVAPSGTASYTVTVTNNDTASCGAAIFSLNVVSDSNSADFTTPSALAPASLSLSSGQTGTSTLSTVARATATNSAVNTTTVQVSAAGHVSPANVSVTTTVSVTSSSPTSSLLHNSNNTGSAKWSSQGGWGVAGGKYGEFVCETCHTKSAANIKGIKQTITVPDTTRGNIPGSSVIFSKVSGTAAAFAAGEGIFGDDTSCTIPAYTDQAGCTANGGIWSARTQSDRICEVCHSITNYHRYNTAVDPDGTGPLNAQTSFNHNNATDCIGCHPHNKGFKGSGDCYTCHLGDQNSTRRAVVNDTSGGDFRKTSHHVTNGTTNQLANKDVCLVCHGDLLADKDHPGTHPTDPAVDLKDPDTGAYVAADESGIEQVCAKCHDANGATRAGLPAGATAAQPFNLSSMTLQDTNTPPNIGWTAAQQAHSYNSGNGAGGCLACHGNAAAAGTTLDPKKNAHGSDQSQMMQFAYNVTIAAYPAANAANFCYNCHGTPVANGAVNNIWAMFGKTRKHISAKCSDCHNAHQAKAGNHTAQANTAGGVLNGVTGVALTTNPGFWAAPTSGSFTQKTIVSGTDSEATLCFKCHTVYSATYNTTSPSGGYAMTDVAREFNPNNVGNYAGSWASGETAGSFHPVLAAATNNLGRTNNIKAPWTTSSLMTCSDCHASDTTTDPNGPHGSAANFILKGPNTIWNTTIAATSSGMPNGTFCINCHNQNYTNSRFTQHASRSDHRVACSKCHVMIPHGSEHPGLLHSAAGRGTGVPAPAVVNSAPYMRATTGSRLYIASYPANNTTSWSQNNCGCNGTSH